MSDNERMALIIDTRAAIAAAKQQSQAFTRRGEYRNAADWDKHAAWLEDRLARLVLPGQGEG